MSDPPRIVVDDKPPADLFEGEIRTLHDRALAVVARHLVARTPPLFCFALVVGFTRGYPRSDGGLQFDLLATSVDGTNSPDLLRFIAAELRAKVLPQIEARAEALERAKRGEGEPTR